MLLIVVLASSGCMGGSRAAELYPGMAEHQNKEIKRIRFVGGEPFTTDTLQSMTDSQPTHCDLLGLPICIPFLSFTRAVHRLNIEAVRRDVARIAGFYRREGYFGTTVIPRAEPLGDSENDISLTFVVRRGDPITLDSLTIDGTEGILDPDSLARRLPLQPGELFDVAEFEASADQVVRDLQARGYAYADLLRNFTVDTLADRAVASLTAIPGVQVHVDSVIVRGADNLGRRATIRQLSIRKGQLLRLDRLVTSQSNLYRLEIVQLASVAVAPDSLQKAPADSATATVLVNISEVPVNQAEAAVGYGNVECGRAEAAWTNRSFGGGARKLNVTTSASKIGIGGFTNAGLAGSICQAFRRDTFENKLDYRVATELTQPFFISASNQLALSFYAERISEPQVYQRQAEGGRLAITRRLATRTQLVGSVDIERAQTVASPVLFCSTFQVCVPEDFERITQPRYRNTIGLSFARDRTDNPINAARGYLLRSGVAWAAPWLSSEVTFVRWSGEAAIYRSLRRGWVFAGSLRLGNFFRTASLDPERGRDDFLPPEERFYAGGATTVRGYDRNALGPGVYVTDSLVIGTDGKPTPARGSATFFPVGGTSLSMVNAEIRFPSPFLRRQLRLAAFVDGGVVGTGNVWNLDPQDMRFTPGVGLRIATPVGPARVDVAYDPYAPVSGVLFYADSASITPIRDDYTPPSPNFWRRLHVHVAIGQAF
jgi:outer membrane protein assembly factor BamA